MSTEYGYHWLEMAHCVDICSKSLDIGVGRASIPAADQDECNYGAKWSEDVSSHSGAGARAANGNLKPKDQLTMDQNDELKLCSTESIRMYPICMFRVGTMMMEGS